MKKSDIVDDVRKKFSLTKKEAKLLVELFFKLIENALASGERVKIRNFGEFLPSIKINGNGKEYIKIKFRASKKFIEELNEIK